MLPSSCSAPWSTPGRALSSNSEPPIPDPDWFELTRRIRIKITDIPLMAQKPTNGSYTLPVADRPQGLTLYKVDMFTFFSALPVKWGLGNMIIRGKLSHFNPPVWCLCQAHQGDFVSRYPGRFLIFLFRDAVFELFLPGRLCIGSFLLRSRYKQLNRKWSLPSNSAICKTCTAVYFFVCLFIGPRIIRV